MNYRVVMAAAALVAGCGKETPPPPRPAPQVTIVTVKSR
jgi:hypothetical protein